MGVEIKGLDGFLDDIEEMVDTEALEQAVTKACLLVERSAKMKVPKGTGELGRSITSEVNVEGDVITGIVYTPLEYAPYVEYGTGLFAEAGNGRKDVPWHYKDDEGNWHSTSGQSPRPFMRPALDENREQIIRLLEGAQ